MLFGSGQPFMFRAWLSGISSGTAVSSAGAGFFSSFLRWIILNSVRPIRIPDSSPPTIVVAAFPRVTTTGTLSGWATEVISYASPCSEATTTPV